MFSTIQSCQYAFTYLPPISSPLVPHGVNVCPTPPFLMASTFEDARKTQSKSRSNRHATVSRKVEEPERRRQVFLKRVKDASDDKRWQTRSDQVLKLCDMPFLRLNTICGGYLLEYYIDTPSGLLIAAKAMGS